ATPSRMKRTITANGLRLRSASPSRDLAPERTAIRCLPRGTGAADAEESESGRAGWPPAVSFSSLTVVLSSTLPDHRDGGRGDRTRTCNLRFWRPLLCQLSYAPSVTVPTCDTVTTVGSATPGHRRPRSSSVLHDRPGSQS